MARKELGGTMLEKTLDASRLSSGARRRSGRWARLGVALVAPCIALSAAGGAAASARKSTPLTNLNVTLALVPPKMLFMGFYAAESEGFFRQEGLNVHLLPEMGGVQAQRVAAAGQAVIVAGGTDGFAALAAEHEPVEAIWNFSKSDFSLIADNSIRTIADLRGKTIGIGDATGPAYELTAIALRSAGVPLSSVHFAVLQGRPALAGALAAGKIQASVFHVDDGYTVLQESHAVHVLLPLYKTAPKYWLSGVSVSKIYARKHGEVLVHFLTALIRADRWMYTHKAATIKLAVAATQETRPVVTTSYNFFVSHQMWSTGLDLTPAEIAYTFREFKANGIIKRIPSISSMFDPHYAEQALAEIGK